MESSKMDTSYLSQQVNSIINQLHGLFDEIGVSDHDRENREGELFDALSETLNNQLRRVTAEKNDLIDEAQTIITTIRQMEASLDDARPRRDQHDEDLQITLPLNKCLQGLKEKHLHISRLHRERFEQVKKLVHALESYSSHLEPSFVNIALPPTGPNQSIPPSFDISPSYVDKLDYEFTRVYEEYTRRIATVQTLSENIIQLWAELGTPQAQTDGAIVKYYRDAPEQLGLHEEDVARLRAKRDKLADEKKNRERRLKDLRASVEALWTKLGVEEGEKKAFLNANRGCGVRQINEFQDELSRLNELKHENLHLFVEDARCKLQELWDALYFSEDEMLEFTPAFSDVYSDALLEAHERELARLEALREQRAPILASVDRHRSLVAEQKELQSSAKDASRLMMRGQKGERRDPGKLLREEKMRKRIARELPKVSAELRKALNKWENEYGRPFLVHGERYLDTLDEEEGKSAAPAAGPRSKTPAGPPPSATRPKSAAGTSRTNSVVRPAPPPRSMTKTPTAGAGQKRAPPTTMANTKGSPSRIPARVPLGNLKHGNNSPERRPESRAAAGPGSMRGPPPPLMRAPPPKMRELAPAPHLETPANPYSASDGLGSIVRSVDPEDPYDDGLAPAPAPAERYANSYAHQHQERQGSIKNLNSSSYPPAPPTARQTSGTSHTSQASTMVSGSENWETYDDNSEPEPDATDTYYAKVRAARIKRVEPESGHLGYSQSKRTRGLMGPPQLPGSGMLDYEGNRIVSGSEWTDEDAGAY
ncbi:related to microtubule-associated protein [Cephalotrichum gorgonifer]|uniref:Related to microtubule-associated protein n=1 Tax=Cephalotrichum gorgonifer TaxID=2041049 RepID=A0AAE8SVX6_9PEZI|nr:related to microtubule-associated protein [Cephalotrichum gorgonifer]